MRTVLVAALVACALGGCDRPRPPRGEGSVHYRRHDDSAYAPRIRLMGSGPEPKFVLAYNDKMVFSSGWVKDGDLFKDEDEYRNHWWPAGSYTIVVSQGDSWGRAEVTLGKDDTEPRDIVVAIERPALTVHLRVVREGRPVSRAEVRIHNFAPGRLSFGGLVGVTNADGRIVIRGVPSDATAIHVSAMDRAEGRHGTIPLDEFTDATLVLHARG